MARIFAGTNGIASSATVYSSNNITGYAITFFDTIDDLMQLETGDVVKVVNCSYGFVNNLNSLNYNLVDGYVDYIVSNYCVTFVAAAGNNIPQNGGNEYVTSPALAHNAITVGAYYDNLTLATNDDVMMAYSSYNENGGCYKPDIVAPINDVNGGTSRATAFVSGVVALMLETRPSLSLYPEVIKAIILASCQRKALPATGDSAELMTSGLTDKQGAGIINAVKAIAIANHGKYGIMTIPSTSTMQSISFKQPCYGATNVNISIAWLKTNVNSNGSTNNQIAHNLNMTVKQGTSTVGASSKLNSSSEMAFIPLSSTNNAYTVNVQRATPTGSAVRFAYAFGTATDRFQYTTEHEKICYLKNAANSSCYMEMNSSLNNLRQTSYTAADNQLWVIQRNPANGLYWLKSAYGTSGGLSVSGQIGNGYYSANIASSNMANVSVLKNADGSVTFVTTIAGTPNGTQYALGTLDASTSANAPLAWSQLGSTPLSHQRWYQEVYAYQKADVDRSGHINTDDARLILRYAAVLEIPNTIQSYLADVDGDGVISTSDAQLAQRYAALME